MAGQAALLEFRDREALEAWLRTQPNEVAMIIAVRTALRVLPLLETASPPAGDLMGQRRFAQLVTLLFHSVALTRFVSLYHNRLGMPPWQSTRSLIARIEFNNEAANSVARTVRAALETVLATAPPVAAHAAQFSAAAAYSSVATSKEMVDAGNEAEADIWNAISFDANSFSAGGLLLHQVAERSVWPTGEPDWSLQRWAQLRTALSEIGDWDCWVKWYDSYARGEYIPEAVELIYATVPPEKWDEGPAAVNVWIKERLQQLQGQGTTEETAPLIIKNQEELESWLRTQPLVVARVIASRAALRALPLLALDLPAPDNTSQMARFSRLAGMNFRLGSLAHVAAKYAPLANNFRSAAAYILNRKRPHNPSANHPSVRDLRAAVAEASTIESAASAARAAAAGASAMMSANIGPNPLSEEERKIIHRSIETSNATAWEFVSRDINALSDFSTSHLANMALWLPSPTTTEWAERPWGSGTPEWAQANLLKLQTAMPMAEDWDVWFLWYQDRLRGGPVPEESDLTYTGVPPEKWDEGPAAANAWIKAELERLQAKPSESPPPQEVPHQVPGPHVEIDVETGAVVLAKPESLDAGGNNLARLAALHPQIVRLAAELLANLSQNEQPELFAAANAYFENVNRDLSQIDFERLWGEGIYLEEAAAAAARRIEDKLREPLNDAALTALQSLQRIHGPFILATKVGLENLAFANAYDLRVEEQKEQFAATKALALKFEANPDVVAPEVAQMVAHYVELPESSTHPERGPAFTGGMMFNISLVLISGAAIRVIKVVAGDEMSAPLSDALKKSKPYANYLSASGLLKDGLDRLSETDARALGSKLKKISFEPYREFVIENEALLRRLAGKRREMDWLHDHLDWLKEMDERKLLPPPHE